MGKLTKAQIDFLEMALRSPSGNPWPLVPLNRRRGGALKRMFEKMQVAGLFDRSNCITEAGRNYFKGKLKDWLSPLEIDQLRCAERNGGRTFLAERAPVDEPHNAAVMSLTAKGLLEDGGPSSSGRWRNLTPAGRAALKGQPA